MTGRGPLFQALEDYLRRGPARFHMPGHKGKLPFPLDAAAPWDLTEVAGTDSLYEAEGAIAAMEREFSRLYGSKASFLSAGGSTLCIQAMLALCAAPGARILCARGVHTAAVNAMALLELSPVWLYPEETAAAGGLMGAVSPATVKTALEREPDVAAVYLTSPNYCGVISDIGGISEVCHSHDIPLLVDNAHGAHLKFLPESLHPMDLGADLCADSLHKTLPVLTGGALLHVANPAYVSGAKGKMALFGSTSPSYLIMLSCDMALPRLREGIAGDLARVSREMTLLADLARSRGFALPSKAADPVRLTLGFGAMGWRAAEFGAYVREHGVEPEYLGEGFCVFLGSPDASADDFAALGNIIRSLPRRHADVPAPPLLPRPAVVMPLRQAMFAEWESVTVEDSPGRVAAGLVSPCPPGISIVTPGEKIDGAIAAALKNYGIFSLNVVK